MAVRSCGVLHHFSMSISSASSVSRLRKNARMMPSPTAASAAASVITNIAKTWPSDVYKRQDELDFDLRSGRLPAPRA